MNYEQKSNLLIISSCFLIGCLISILVNGILKTNYTNGEIRNSERMITSNNAGSGTDTTGAILKTGTTSKTARTSKPIKETNQGGTEPILNPLRSVGGGREGANEYQRVINRIDDVINDSELATHTAWECYRQTANPKLCVENVIGVSNSESSMFKNCSNGNNCFGVMIRQSDGSYRLREYESKKSSISDRVSMYQRLERYKRTTAQAWLNGHYCTNECAYWIGNYNTAVAKLGF